MKTFQEVLTTTFFKQLTDEMCFCHVAHKEAKDPQRSEVMK